MLGVEKYFRYVNVIMTQEIYNSKPTIIMLGVEKYFRYVNVIMTLLLKIAIWLVIHKFS